MRRLPSLLALALLWPMAATATAQIAMDGRFTATRDCPATVSTKTGSNPGAVAVAQGQSYRLLGRNRDAASHYWIEIPGAEPARRWVAADCGATGADAAADATPAPPAAKPAARKGGRQPFHILALSWQPAFCEGLPGKVECRALAAASPAARQLSLHGLWPQPGANVYCGVPEHLVVADKAGRWDDLPAADLLPSTRRDLEAVMPGTRSLLERHEWIKHGSCFGDGFAEPYFRESVRLAGAVNDSAVGRLFAANVGKTLRGGDIRAAFDRAFGAGTGERVRLSCDSDGRRQLIVEMTLGLVGDIAAGASLAELLAASRPTDPGCPGGIVDPAGLQ